ncbi:MAG: citN, partial [Bacillota bacterium]|nr:citN [Bacillota bacterium]
MSPLIMAIIMLAIVIASVFYKKVPMFFILGIVPIICALILGMDIKAISKAATDQLSATMNSAGYMLLFALMYFNMLTETGMFDTFAKGIIRMFRGKVNVWTLMILTTGLTCIGMLTASVSTAFMLAIPIVLPIIKKMNFDRQNAYLMIITAIAAMCFIPWGIGIVITATFVGIDPQSLASATVPISLCFIPVIIAQYFYFASYHKKHSGIMSVDISEAAMTSDDLGKLKSNLRPKLFWFNFIMFIAVIVCLGVIKLPSYIVFFFATLITTLVNYPDAKDHHPLWMKAGGAYFNILLMLVGIAIFVGLFTASGMMAALADGIIAVFPKVLLRYLHLILLAVLVIALRVVPYQIYNSLYPVLVSIAGQFGIAPAIVAAPFVTNLALGTSGTPLNTATFVGASLLEIK